MSSPRLPLSARPSFLPDEISRREFATVFRGYDPSEVRTFLNQLAEQSSEISDRVAEIQRALAETEERVKNPELDEEMVTRLLGEQTAQILRSAREAGNDMRSKSEEEVSRQLRESHEVATKMREEAEKLLADRTEEAERMAETVRAEAAADAERMRTEATDEAAAIRKQVADEAERDRASVEGELLRLRQQTQSDLVDERSKARAQAREIIDTARTEAQALVTRTQERQTELVEGLVRKRKIALAQVEELRAGRQRLLQAYKLVRGSLDEVTAELERVEEEARGAAELAGARSASQNEIAQEDLAEVIELQEFSLDDDIPSAVIDLVSAEHDERPEMPALYDIDNDAGGSSGGGSGGGSASTATIQREETVQELWPKTADDVTALDEDDSDNDDQDEDVQEIRSTSSSLIIGESFSSASGDEGMDQALKLRRDAVVGKAHSQAVRRLKRALQDEQDALVAKLRTGDGESVQALLGSTEDQSTAYHRTVVKLFREVVRTGASSVEGSAGLERGVVDRTGNSAARGLAIELVEDLRGQLEPVLEQLIGAHTTPDANEIQHRVAEPYRSVKSDYLDRLVDDRIGGVFDQGVAFARG